VFGAIAIMISAASNCCRVDAVKASANQLKVKFAQHPAGDPADSTLRSARQELQALDGQLQSGDANKAELALSAAKLSIEKLDYAALKSADHQHQARYGSLDIRA
jgi:hypothetical protein